MTVKTDRIGLDIGSLDRGRRLVIECPMVLSEPDLEHVEVHVELFLRIRRRLVIKNVNEPDYEI